MARISLTPRRTLFFRVMEWYSKRTYGKVLDPGRALAHNPRVLRSDLAFERSVAKWNALDPDLKALAEMAASASIGCSWCMDFGYWVGRERGMAREKLLDVPRWRESEVYTPLERDVLEYAEAMTATPPASAIEHSPPRSACTAMCKVTSEEEQAVSTVTEGPVRSYR